MADSIESIVERTCAEQGVPRVPPADVLDRVARVQVLAERRIAAESERAA